MTARLEGLHAVKHAMRFGAIIRSARCADRARLLALAAGLAPDVADRIGALAVEVDDPAVRAVPTGIVAEADVPTADVAALLAGPGRVVFLERPSHHGNVGAAVRVAAAAGATGLLTSGSLDPWHPHALRGSAGLHFALAVARVDDLPSSDRPVVAFDPDGDPLGGAPLPARGVLAFGSERRGLSARLLARADHRVAIPMRPGVSSLNLATAVAVALYAEAAATASS